jgi:hypothetical protein
LRRRRARTLQPQHADAVDGSEALQPRTTSGYRYGLGGPKILVSHPPRGALGELYDPYVNSGEVMTNLILAGYSGTFLLLTTSAA